MEARTWVKVLGARVDVLWMDEVITRIGGYISEGRPRQVITVNAELLYRAQRERELLDLINQADLVTADGIGVVWAARTLGTPVSEKVSGIDMIQIMAPTAAEKGWRLFLLGSAPGTAEAAAERLSRLAPGINIVGCHHGYFKPGPEEEELLKMIEEKSPDLLLVALGAPRQDYWIRDHLVGGRLRVPVSMGIGGSLDVLSGKVKRAPRWMSKTGMEWIWRLIQEPWRYKRMSVLPLFVLLVIRIKRKQEKSKGKMLK